MDGEHEKKQFNYPKREQVIEQIKALDDDIEHVSLNLIKCNFDATEKEVEKAFPQYKFIKVKNYNPGSFQVIFQMKIDAINFIRNCFDRKILGRRFFIKMGRQHKQVVEDWACIGYVPKKFTQHKKNQHYNKEHKGPHHHKKEQGEKKTEKGGDGQKNEQTKQVKPRPQRTQGGERQHHQRKQVQQQVKKQQVKKQNVQVKKEQKKQVVVPKPEQNEKKPQVVSKVQKKEQTKAVEKRKQQKQQQKKVEVKQVQTTKQKQPSKGTEEKKQAEDEWITVPATKGKKR